MRWMAPSLVATLLSVAFAFTSPAGAAELALRGVVVGVDRSAGVALIRHEPFGGMPAMTMPFRIARPALGRLHAGDRISGRVGRETEPWTLRDLRMLGRSPVAFVPMAAIGDPLPEFRLTDQRGRPFSLRGLGGEAVLLSFIYTRCGDAAMCPLVSAKFARLQRLIDPARAHLVLVTLDPAFDTPAVLARYGAAFGADPRRWTLATGAPDEIAALRDRAGIVSTEQGPSTILHSEALLILDPRGRLADRIDGNAWSAEEAVADLHAILGEPANPLSRLLLALSRGVSALCGGRSGVTVAGAIGIFLVALAAFGLLARRVLRAAPTTRCAVREPESAE